MTTPFLSTAVWRSGSTGEQWYLYPKDCGCGESAEAGRLCIHVTFVWDSGCVLQKLNSTESVCWKHDVDATQVHMTKALEFQTFSMLVCTFLFKIFCFVFLLPPPEWLCYFIGIPVYFKTLPFCFYFTNCQPQIKETLTAHRSHQEEYVHCSRYQCCLQSIVKLKDKRKLKL